MASTLYRIDGIKLSNGKQAYGSKEMSVWLPVFVRLMREVHGIRLTIIKVADLTATVQSAGTHLRGYAVDERTWSLTVAQQRQLVYQSTRYGRPTHLRTKAQGFDPHAHSMLDVGYATPCSYQITRTKQGRDGLARNGADLDKGHRPPQPWPGWAVGLTQMLVALGEASLKPATPTGELTMAQIDDIMAELAVIKANTATAFGPLGGREYLNEHNKTTGNYILKHRIGRGAGTTVIQELTDIRSDTIALRGQLAGMLAALQSVAAGQGVDLSGVEEAAERGARKALQHTTITFGSEGA